MQQRGASGNIERVNVDPGVQRFNEAFYRSDPADYLQTRWELLLLAAGKQRELAALLADGVEFENVRLGPGDDTSDEDSEVPDLSAFVTIESQQLLHHASETLLRLFLVHADRLRVPWVVLRSQTSLSALKKDVRATFVDGVPAQEVVGYVCLGNRTCPEQTPRDEWDGSVEGLVAFLRTFAQRFLDDANLYNGIKHGLGVTAGQALLLIDQHQMGDGPSVEYPEFDPWTPQRTRTWRLTTRWLDISESLALTRVAVHMIDSIWRIGRSRHGLGDSIGDVFLPGSMRPADLRSPGRAPMTRMSMTVLEETRAP